MKKKAIEIPTFATEAEEADWWASRQGRAFLNNAAASIPKTKAGKGSRLIGKLNRARTAQTSKKD